MESYSVAWLRCDVEWKHIRHANRESRALVHVAYYGLLARPWIYDVLDAMTREVKQGQQGQFWHVCEKFPGRRTHRMRTLLPLPRPELPAGVHVLLDPLHINLLIC